MYVVECFEQSGTLSLGLFKKSTLLVITICICGLGDRTLCCYVIILQEFIRGIVVDVKFHSGNK